jgi:hypothetical protein
MVPIVDFRQARDAIEKIGANGTHVGEYLRFGCLSAQLRIYGDLIVLNGLAEQIEPRGKRRKRRIVVAMHHDQYEQDHREQYCNCPKCIKHVRFPELDVMRHRSRVIYQECTESSAKAGYLRALGRHVEG